MNASPHDAHVLRELASALGKAIAEARGGDVQRIKEARDLAGAVRDHARAAGLELLAAHASRLFALLAVPPARWGVTVDEVLAAASYEAERTKLRPSSYGLPATLLAGRILVVDPDASTRTTTSDAIRANLVEAISTGSIEEALHEGLRRHPDAMIVNADLEGIERLHAALGKPPFAILGRDGLTSHRAAAAKQGASLYVQRPIDTEELSVTVRRLLDRARTPRPKVLLVDDSPHRLVELSRKLDGVGMTVQTLSDPTRVLEVLDEIRPDLVLVEAQMEPLDGWELCAVLRTAPEWQDLPIVFLGDGEDPESRAAAFRVGADDFVPRNNDLQELTARLLGRIERTRLLRDRGDRDFLTGLLRRSAFLNGFSSLLNQARRRNRPLALAILDLDHFKQVNDRFGHLAGDRVLVAVGKLLADHLRGEDLRGRWGGEEIVIAFPESTRETAAPAVRRMLEDMAKLAIEDDGEVFHVTFSAGVASFPGDGPQPMDLFATADRRLYLAKRLGRARVLSEG